MAKVEIEEGIPMPEGTSRGGGSKYPWKDMEVGQSFFVTGTKSAPGTPKHISDEGLKFRGRPDTKDGVEGFRVWRVE